MPEDRRVQHIQRRQNCAFFWPKTNILKVYRTGWRLAIVPDQNVMWWVKEKREQAPALLHGLTPGLGRAWDHGGRRGRIWAGRLGGGGGGRRGSGGAGEGRGGEEGRSPGAPD